MLKDVNVNTHVTARLIEAVKAKTISHAYVFEGDSKIDKKGLAENFVKAILCEQQNGEPCENCTACRKLNHGNYEDLYYLHGEGNSIKDEEVEEIQARLKKKPCAGERNIVIISRADLMTVRAQNRLLKTLEEPFPGTVIILLSENIESLVQTILSRCVVYRLTSGNCQAQSDCYVGAARIGGMMLAGERFYKISAEIEKFAGDRVSAVQFLEALELWLRNLMIAPYDKKNELIAEDYSDDDLLQRSRLYRRERIYQGIEAAEEAKKDINRNMNVSYTLKSLILQMS